MIPTADWFLGYFLRSHVFRYLGKFQSLMLLPFGHEFRHINELRQFFLSFFRFTFYFILLFPYLLGTFYHDWSGEKGSCLSAAARFSGLDTVGGCSRSGYTQRINEIFILMHHTRLYFQHWMWRRQLGYLLNPNIPVKEGFKLADIACGTGWVNNDIGRCVLSVSNSVVVEFGL